MQRVTEYVWDPSHNRLQSVTVAGQSRTNYAYNAAGRLASRSLVNLSANGVTGQVRTTHYGYTLHANGMLASITEDGPIPGSADTVTRTYNAVGDLVEIINGLGHVTTYSHHTGLGQPQRITGTNGHVTDTSYDAQGRVVTSRQWQEGSAADTVFTYESGLLVGVRMPDGQQRHYQYDQQRRLIGQFQRKYDGRYAVHSTTYNAMSLPTIVETSHAPYPPTTRISGNIDGVFDTGGGQYAIRGWACSTGFDSPVAVHMYLGGAAGSGAHGFAYGTGHASEPAVAHACQSYGTAHRFSIPVDTTMRQNYGGKRIYVHGISPAGRDNSLIGASGAFEIPPLPPPPQAIDNAQFVSQSVPEGMVVNQPYAVSVTVRNTGNTTWATATGNYALGSQSPHDNTFWTGSNRVPLPHAVSPGEQVTFSFTVTAAALGQHNFQWRMANDGVHWFGDATHNVVVEIVPPYYPPLPPPNPCGPVYCEVPAIAFPAPGWADAVVANKLALGTQPRRDAIPQGMPVSTMVQPASAPGVTVVHRAFIDYDELGRVRARRGNHGQSTGYGYDANGNVLTVSDALGRTTTMAYDALNRPVHSADAAGGVTTFAYDTADQLVRVVDPRGNATTYDLDGFGQLWRQVSPDTGATTFEYDAAGLRTRMTRNDGSWLSYTYDGAGRLTWAGNDHEVQGYTYDWCERGLGRLCGADYAGGTRHFAYKPDGRLWMTRDMTPHSDDWTAHAYDLMGRLTGISYPSGVSAGYGYRDGQLSIVQATINGATHDVVRNLEYAPTGALTRLVYGSGKPKELSYDLDGRLTTRHDHYTLGHSYHYNATDEIVGIDDWSRPHLSRSLAYDALSRLTTDVSTATQQSFAYDALGNRTAHGWDGHASYPGYAGHNNHIQYVTMTTGRPAQYFNHDGRGNIDASDGRHYSYDAFNRLRSHTRHTADSELMPGGETRHFPAGTTTYTVNALGQRVAKSGPLGNSRYVYGGQNTLLAEQTNGQWSSYIWLGGEPIGLVRDNQLYYLHNDQLGRPEVATDHTGNSRWIAANHAFDRQVLTDSIGGLNLGFPGQYFDAESGHWYNGFRDYDPRTGRYVQSDPIGLGGGLNTYAYVGGNPVSRFDPFGLTQCDIDVAFSFAKVANPDIRFGAGAPKADIPREGAEGQAQLRGGVGHIHLNERYLDVLDWSGIYNLLDTIIHEGLHFTRPIGLQEKSNNYDHQYISPEATRRAREQVHDFNKQRQSKCGCN